MFTLKDGDEVQFLCEPCFEDHMEWGRQCAEQEDLDRRLRTREQEAEDRQEAADLEYERRRDAQLTGDTR